VTVRRTTRRPPYAATAIALMGFALVSLAIPAATQAFGGNVPPLFARWDPSIGPLIVVPILMAAAAWWIVPRLPRVPRWAMLGGAVAFGWAFALALAAQSGGLQAITEPFRRPLDYAANVPLVDSLGPRAFARLYPQLIESGRLSLHATTHPPGASLLAWALSRATDGSLAAMSAIVALIGVACAVPTFALAREAYGEGPAAAAAVLFVSVPGVVLFSATSMDAVFMTLIALAMAALVRAPRSDAWAVGGGLLTAVALLFTFAALALAPVALGFGLLAWKGRLASGRAVPAGPLVRRAVVALAAAVAGLLLLRVALGVDLLAVFRATLHAHVDDPSRGRSYWYWLIGDVGAFLIAVGVAVTALVISGAAERWRTRRPSLEAILVGVVVLAAVSGLFRGEVDHIWLFLVPLAAASAGDKLSRMDPGPLTEAAAMDLRLPVLIGLSQAILMEVLLFMFW